MMPCMTPAILRGICCCNTCGFIADAKEESIEMLLDLAKLKQEEKSGKLSQWVVLPKRYREELTTELPENRYHAG